ncbi:MAG: extracellular solute-binding protein [Rhodobacteraceae bacterium]|nr:extracellular solute-binding protein [Paracoccaceae bacterium]
MVSGLTHAEDVNSFVATGESTVELGELQHGLAMHDAPALPENFTHLPYVDPNAPQGGRLVRGERSGFVTLNPYIPQRRSVWAVRELVFESLMARSYDEPFTLYGLLAEGVATPPDRSSVTFLLRPEARFSNGDPVTVEDVVWSMKTLRDKGTRTFNNMYKQVSRIDRLGERGVRFVFEKPNRELPLLMGLMPIFSKRAWEGREFTRWGLEPPIASGPYVVAEVEGERRVVFRKNPDYWGAHLPVNQGRHTLDEIEYIFFRDGSAMWEAFTSGKIGFYPEGDPARWADAYDFPAIQDGRVKRAEIAHKRPSGLRGFVFNTRRPFFADRRVREAFALAFDFTWANQRLYGGGYERMESYFSGSSLGFSGEADAAERKLLDEAAGGVAGEQLLTSWRPPAGAGNGKNRRNLRKAKRLLAEAGWNATDDGVLRNAEGKPFSFELIVRGNANERLGIIFADALETLGVVAQVNLIDSAQYQERLSAFDFDMIVHFWYASLSPGEEQRHYWGSAAADQNGTRNYMGVKDPVIDALISALIAAESRDAFEAAARALDRALNNGVYVIPFGYLTHDLVAYRSEYDRPAYEPLYGRRDEVWWRWAE